MTYKRALLDAAGLKEEPLFLCTTTNPGTHLTLAVEANGRPATLLVDSGATGVFIHSTFATTSHTTITAKSASREIRVIDGLVIKTGLITHEATFQLVVGDHIETVTADITSTGRYNLVLGTPQL